MRHLIRSALLPVAFLICACADGPSYRPPSVESEVHETEKDAMVDALDPRHLRSVLASRLWEVPLGRTYRTFLTADLNYNEIVAMSDALTLRLFTDPSLAITKSSILQLLAEDLFESGGMTPDAQSRLLILEGSVSLQRVQLSRIPLDEMAMHSVGLALLAIPWGSPQARRYLKDLSRWTLGRLRLIDRSPRPHPPPVSARAYEPAKAATAFLNLFGAYSLIYLFWYDWNEAPAGELVKNLLTEQTIDEIVAEAWTY